MSANSTGHSRGPTRKLRQRDPEEQRRLVNSEQSYGQQEQRIEDTCRRIENGSTRMSGGVTGKAAASPRLPDSARLLFMSVFKR